MGTGNEKDNVGKALADALKKKGMAMTAEPTLTGTTLEDPSKYLYDCINACPYMTILTHLYDLWATNPPTLILLTLFHGVTLQRLAMPYFGDHLPCGLSIIDYTRLGLVETGDLNEAYNRATEIWGFVHHSIMADLGGPHRTGENNAKRKAGERDYRSGMGWDMSFSPIGKDLLVSWIKRSPKLSPHTVGDAYFAAWKVFIASIKTDTYNAETRAVDVDARRKLLMNFISGPLSGPPKDGNPIAPFEVEDIEELMKALEEDRIRNFIPGEVVMELKSMLLEHGRGSAKSAGKRSQTAMTTSKPEAGKNGTKPKPITKPFDVELGKTSYKYPSKPNDEADGALSLKDRDIESLLNGFFPIVASRFCSSNNETETEQVESFVKFARESAGAMDEEVLTRWAKKTLESIEGRVTPSPVNETGRAGTKHQAPAVTPSKAGTFVTRTTVRVVPLDEIASAKSSGGTPVLMERDPLIATQIAAILNKHIDQHHLVFGFLNSKSYPECTTALDKFFDAIKKGGNDSDVAESERIMRDWAKRRFLDKPVGYAPPTYEDIVAARAKAREGGERRSSETNVVTIQGVVLKDGTPVTPKQPDAADIPLASNERPVTPPPSSSSTATPTIVASPSLKARFAGLFTRAGKSQTVEFPTPDITPVETPRKESIASSSKLPSTDDSESFPPTPDTQEPGSTTEDGDVTGEDSSSLEVMGAGRTESSTEAEIEDGLSPDPTRAARESCQWLCRRLFVTRLFDPRAFNCEQSWMSTTTKQLLLAAVDRSIPLLLAIMAATSSYTHEEDLLDTDAVYALARNGVEWKDGKGNVLENEWKKWPIPPAPVIAPREMPRKVSLKDRWPYGPGKQTEGRFPSSKQIRVQDAELLGFQDATSLALEADQILRCLYPVPLEYSQASLPGKALQEAVFLMFENQMPDIVPRMKQIMDLAMEEKDVEYKVLRIDLPMAYNILYVADLLSDYPVDVAADVSKDGIAAYTTTMPPLLTSCHHHLALSRQITTQYRDQLPRRSRDASGKDLLDIKPAFDAYAYEDFDKAVKEESRKRKVENLPPRPPATREDLSAAIKAKQQKRMKKSHR